MAAAWSIRRCERKWRTSQFLFHWSTPSTPCPPLGVESIAFVFQCLVQDSTPPPLTQYENGKGKCGLRGRRSQGILGLYRKQGWRGWRGGVVGSLLWAASAGYAERGKKRFTEFIPNELPKWTTI